MWASEWEQFPPVEMRREALLKTELPASAPWLGSLLDHQPKAARHQRPSGDPEAGTTEEDGADGDAHESALSFHLVRECDSSIGPVGRFRHSQRGPPSAYQEICALCPVLGGHPRRP